MTTKEKILAASLQLFNQKGFGAAKLYHIAQALEISRGNLTYHFKDKESLLEVHADRMVIRYNEGLVKSIIVPSWHSLQKATIDFFEVQNEYGFIFFDKSVIQLPIISEKLAQVRAKNIQAQMAMINVSIQMGNMNPEKVPGIYHNLCRSCWMISSIWQLAKSLQNMNEQGWDKIVWSLLLPHFTDQGIESFKEHFGEEYYRSLGKPYEEYMNKLVNF